MTVAGAGALPSLMVGASQTISGSMGESFAPHVGATNTSGYNANVSWLLDLFGLYSAVQGKRPGLARCRLCHRRCRQAHPRAGSRVGEPISTFAISRSAWRDRRPT